MVLSKWLAGPSCALAFATIAAPAWSYPFASARTLVVITTASRPQQIAYRTCTIQGGVRRCYRVNTYGPGTYGYTAPSLVPPVSYGYRNEYRPTDPNDYYIGTGYWWRGMDRWDKGGTH
jgi:hypothetical protein